jgi:hypothetical protein
MKKWLKFQYNSIYNSIMFWYKKKEADRLHQLTGRRYFVIPAGNKLAIVDNRSIAAFNRAQPKGKRITINDLLKESYYATPLQGLNRR